MKMKFLFKLVALMTIISVVGCSDDVGVGPKGKLYFSDSKSWKDSGTLIYENFDPSYIVPYSYHVMRTLLVCFLFTVVIRMI